MCRTQEIDDMDTSTATLLKACEEAVEHAARIPDGQFVGAGEKPGMEVWRVDNRRVVHHGFFTIATVSKEGFRDLYRGDSFIYLISYIKVGEDGAESLQHNVHFWIGSESTQDEYAVAAMKTVELDDMLGGKPVQYREMEGFESDLFLSYFKEKGVCPGGLRYLEGGFESGFRSVKIESYNPRLLWVRKEGKTLFSSQVTLALSSLNVGDCFVLDTGANIVVFRGEEAGGFEKNSAMSIAKEMASERHGKSTVVDSDDFADFFKVLGAKDGDAIPSKVTHDAKEVAAEANVSQLWSMHDDTLEFEMVQDGPLSEDMLRDDDVMLVRVNNQLVVSVGASAPVKEKALALIRAQAFLQDQCKDLSPFSTIMRVTVHKDTPNDPILTAILAAAA
mmetsp:Transcript_47381/g.108044  ORF Transcript_47381/g.108044 Transcript_47381/m.108044 type:complete len:391 (+) Transcript_47381:53-1225(+)